MGSLIRESNRLKWGGALGVGLLLVLFVVAGSWFAAQNDDSPAPTEFTPVSSTPTPASSGAATPPSRVSPRPATPMPHVHGTPVGSPGATPQSAAIDVPDSACHARCLVRAGNTGAVNAILAGTGERPAHVSDAWLWTIVARETVDRLRGTGTPVLLVQDSPETLYLYATRLPDNLTTSAAVTSLGTVLDNVDGHSIVRVDSVPPVVNSIVAERIWIEKIKPAAPLDLRITAAGNGDALSGEDLGVLMPQVDSDAIWRTVTDLQAMSSTDGTGIGTRQYSRPGNVMTAEYLFTRLESMGLKVWYEDFITWEGYLVSNVLGEIPGKDASMIYGVMAHLDSTAASFDEAPGADDNASGVAGTLEIARILAGYRLEHPVHIIFVNAEETMIIGSMAYAAGVVQNAVPIEGIFNMDTIANPVYGTRLILNSGPQSAWMTDLLIRINNGYGLGQSIQAYQVDTIVSDDTMLRNQGIESVLVARLLADDYGVHHSADDTTDNMSVDNTVSATQLVLLAIGALVQ